MNLGLKDKTALVTGGSYGIGRAIALALAVEGCRVAICARGKERLEQTANEIQKLGAECLPIVADALAEDDTLRVVNEVVARWKSIDILVNNVGGGRVFPGTPVDQIPQNEWIEAFQRNALAAVRFTLAVIPHMRCSKWGRVVAIASIKGREGGGMPWYTMSKSAEIAFMKSMALNAELVRDGITFNSIAPGRVLFEGNAWDLFRKEAPDRYRLSMDRVPLGRAGTPEEIASVVTFVCSEPARLVNGACIAVDGGESFSF